MILTAGPEFKQDPCLLEKLTDSHSEALSRILSLSGA